MKKVRILLDLPRTIDGQRVGPFTQGQVCDLEDDVAETFIGSAMAEEYTEPSEPVEEKPAPPPAVVADDGAAAAAQADSEGTSRRSRRRPQD